LVAEIRHLSVSYSLPVDAGESEPEVIRPSRCGRSPAKIGEAAGFVLALPSHLIAEQKGAAADPKDDENPEGAFSPHGNSIPAQPELQRVGFNYAK